MYVNNPYPNVPDTLALRCSSSANTQLGRMASTSKWSVKMLEIPPVPLGIPCSKKCLSVAVGTTLPWPGESLNAEFKRPVLEISKTTAANVKPLWLKRRVKWSFKKAHRFHPQKILSHCKLAVVESHQLPANKTDELFQQKTLLRGLLFRVQTKQTPVHNNEPANERNIHTQKPRVFSLACDTSSRYVLQKDSLRKQNAAEPVSTAQRLLTPCSKRNRQFSTEFPWMESRLAMWPPANGKESNHRSLVNNGKKAARGLKLVANIKRYFFPTYNAVCSRE